VETTPVEPAVQLTKKDNTGTSDIDVVDGEREASHEAGEPDQSASSAPANVAAEPALVAAPVGGAPPGDPTGTAAPARPAAVRASATVAPPAVDTDAPRDRRRRIVAVVIALIVVLSGAVWLAVRDSDVDGPERGQPGAGNPTATAPQPQGSAAPSVGGAATATNPPANPPANPPPGGDATGAPGGQRPALPAGWREYTDSTGFSLYVPANWRVSREGTILYFRGDGRVLGIDQTDQPRPDPVADWRGQAATRVSRGDFPNYSEIRIEAVPFWQKAADWEFTYGSGGRRTHVNNRGFVVSPRKAYGIWWQAPDAEWPDAVADLQTVFDSFRPSPAALG
jgi:hypothetical protein